MTIEEAIEQARWYEREDIPTILRKSANVLADEVERLRGRLKCARCGSDSSRLDAAHHCSTCHAESQATVKRLETEVERLREALRPLLAACEQADVDLELDSRIDGELLDAARAALEGKL